MVSTVGLVLFVLMVAIAAALLVDDLVRALRGKKTITEWATEKPWREWLLIAGVSLGAFGFALHLLTFTG